MSRVKGPLFSMSASGQLGKALVFSTWKGRPYCREYVIPENPNATKQENVRHAFQLLVLEWQGESAPYKLEWETYAAPFAMSGFNKYMAKGMDAYVTQLTTAVDPASVSVSGTPPADVWVWA